MELYALTYLVYLIRTMHNPITPSFQPIQFNLMVKFIKKKVSQQLIPNHYMSMQQKYTYF